MDFCCDVSVELNEPVEGSALAEVRHWLMIEVSTQWAPKTLDAPALSALNRDHIQSALAQLPGSRLQLIRRPEARQGIVVKAATVGGRVFAVQLPSLEALNTVDILGLFAGNGEEVHGSVVLVCTHGIRDACCAREGAPVFQALQKTGTEHLWQTTHLGGHRFAATLVVLPAGLQFGRVTPTEVPLLISELNAGRVYRLDRYRGCTQLPRHAQVVEAHLRRRDNLREIASVVWRGEEGGVLNFDVLGRPTRAQVQSSAHPQARAVSCGSDQLKNPLVYSVSASE